MKRKCILCCSRKASIEGHCLMCAEAVGLIEAEPDPEDEIDADARHHTAMANEFHRTRKSYLATPGLTDRAREWFEKHF